jgi:hypothetical protein
MEKEVLVTWRDDPRDEFFTYVVISDDMITDYSEVNDDGVFYYFSTVEEYEDALENGTEEFTIREYKN